jgi:hypothetical protein
MGIQKTVFADKSEKKNYDKLTRTWSEQYKIYHNLPFLNVFTLENLIDFTDFKNPKPIELDEDEITALKHTSIDYVLCDSSDRPIACVEFDGLQDGFSVGSDYYPERLPPKLRLWRRLKIELKLKVAHGSSFPFFVVGSQHFKDITPHSRLTIVDAVLGEVLSVEATRERLSHGFCPTEIGYSEEEFESLPEYVRQELLQDWVIGVEVEAELEHNPVSLLRAKEDHRLGVTSWTTHSMQYPPIPDNTSLLDRIGLVQGAVLYGARVIIHHSGMGDIEGEAWLPNFKSTNFSPYGVVENIAGLIALDRLRSRLGISA